MALARASYEGSRQGVDIFEDLLTYKVLPREAMKDYDVVAGTKGHLIDYTANIQDMKDFLFSEAPDSNR